MSKANQKFFTQRGEITKNIEYNNEKIKVKLNIPTNFEHDKIMEEFTEVTEFGTIVRGADLVEERLIRNIIDLSFEIPSTENVDGDYVEWASATEDEKRCAVRTMDLKLRELINNAFIGESELTEDEVGN